MSAFAKERFSRLVLPRLDEAYRLARWLTGSAADAEDIVQEASLRAYRAMETFVEENARAWFLTIVRNLCYSWLQKRKAERLAIKEDKDPADEQVMETGGVHTHTPDTPESLLIAKQETMRLTRVIDALPVDLKEILVLREYHALAYRDIAAISGVPLGTVMSRLARARQRLMQLLEDSH
ncbi:sigma-70 family RNA polymerase sigma factor [Beijerinckia mobilis]|uniref:sigma-70 family RNA polymerase sigma factor n=1 Tax=Beijerinckia mobilis TaxID=231434 RepID=UPI00054FF191|nr:sigma-70 family RNA polymerase sigma factor [Beijerinckia mobilis]